MSGVLLLLFCWCLWLNQTKWNSSVSSSQTFCNKCFLLLHHNIMWQEMRTSDGQCVTGGSHYSPQCTDYYITALNHVWKHHMWSWQGLRLLKGSWCCWGTLSRDPHDSSLNSFNKPDNALQGPVHSFRGPLEPSQTLFGVTRNLFKATWNSYKTWLPHHFTVPWKGGTTGTHKKSFKDLWNSSLTHRSYEMAPGNPSGPLDPIKGSLKDPSSIFKTAWITSVANCTPS